MKCPGSTVDLQRMVGYIKVPRETRIETTREHHATVLVDRDARGRVLGIEVIVGKRRKR